MHEWLSETFPSDVDLRLDLLVARMGVALVFGVLVAFTYRFTRRQTNGDAPNLMPTLVLLTVLIAMVTLAIGNNVARAFSLVGALAIVRFRTVVEDTRDTAFVIFAVGVGLAVGAGFLLVPLIGIPVAALAAFLFRGKPTLVVQEGPDLSLTIRVGTGHPPESLLREPFEKYLERSHLQSAATARQGASLDLVYRVRLRDEGGAVPLVAELNRMEGVQGVELR